LRVLEESGLANAFVNVPSDQRITFPGDDRRSKATFDYIFTRNAGLAASPRISPAAWSEHYPVTCDLDLNAPKVVPAAAPIARVELPPPANVPKPPVSAQTNRAPAPPIMVQSAVMPANPGYNITWVLAGAVSGGVLLVLLVWRLARRTRVRPAATTLLAMKVEAGASISLPTDSERIVITHPSSEAADSA